VVLHVTRTAVAIVRTAHGTVAKRNAIGGRRLTSADIGKTERGVRRVDEIETHAEATIGYA
jgi:hypothetical protein